MRRAASPPTLALLLLVVMGCEAPVTPTTLIGRRSVSAVPTTPPWQGEDVMRPGTRAVFDGRLELLGARLDESAVGVRGTSWWLVVGDLAGRLKPELTVTVGSARHAVPLVAALHPLEWRHGDVVEAAFSVGAAGGDVGLGIADAGRDWPGTAGNVIVIGTRSGGEHGPVVMRRRSDVVVDGVIDEADWAAAAPITLRPWKKGAPVTQATTVRFLWDAEHLFLAFDVDDDDPHSPYTARDAPLYESEALELFIDADGDRDVYVELQASPTNVHFDAAFAGGPRRNMDVGWNAPFSTATAPRPGGYTQEWQIPVAALKDIPAGEPRAGARWPVNVFRLERRRELERVTTTEASALSPPERGDFHALDRMVPLTFRD